MNKLVSAVAVIALSALGAGAVIYANGQTKNTFMDEQQLHQQIEKYINNNSHKILEVIAKDDSFGTTIKNFTMISDEELNAKINAFFAEHPSLLDDYLREHANDVAETLAQTDTFKNMGQAVNTEEPKENTEEQTEEKNEQLPEIPVTEIEAPPMPKLEALGE